MDTLTVNYVDPVPLVKALFIEPDSPRENGHNQSFNRKLRYELLAREIFHSLKGMQILTEQWRHE